MKIYTRTGDKGKTRIIGNDVMFKSDKRVEAYGSVDELNSLVGMVIANLSDKTKELGDELTEIQQLLFDCGTDLATVQLFLPCNFPYCLLQNISLMLWHIVFKA